MTTRPPFATAAELSARHGDEVATLAADPTSRQVDPARVEAALDDVSTEIRALLRSRYTADELDSLDAESAGVLRLFALDMALYRVAFPPRQTEAIQLRYKMAVDRLRDMAKGAGGLTVVGQAASGGAGVTDPAIVSNGSPNEALIDANPRLFTRRRFGGAG